MDEFIDAMENFLNTAKNNTAFNTMRLSNKWKECVELLEDGWKITDYAEIENSSDIIIKWARREKEREMRISFTNQVQWLEYLEKHKKEKVYVK